MVRKLFSLICFLALSAPLYAAKYQVDTVHSQVIFKVRHLISTVTGRFDNFDGSFSYDPNNLMAFSAKGTIPTSSINTNNSKRDEHLRASDFFDAANYPELKFESSGVSDIKGNKAKLKGNLTLRGVAKPVVFDIEFLGTAKDPWGDNKAALHATTKINRYDFGMKWNQALEAGGVLVGEEVEIILEIQGNMAK